MRDATWEETLHLVRDYGVRRALPALQARLDGACAEALLAGAYWPNKDLEDMGTVCAEYAAMVLEAEWGMWDREGGRSSCGDAEYMCVTAAEARRVDGAALGALLELFPSAAQGGGTPVAERVKSRGGAAAAGAEAEAEAETEEAAVSVGRGQPGLAQMTAAAAAKNRRTAALPILFRSLPDVGCAAGQIWTCVLSIRVYDLDG